MDLITLAAAKKLAKGGGSDLPAVTALDIGKVLTVQSFASKGAVIAPEQSIEITKAGAVLSNANASLFIVDAMVIVMIDETEYIATVTENQYNKPAVDIIGYVDSKNLYIVKEGNDLIVDGSANTISISINLVSISGVWAASMMSSPLIVTETDSTLDKTWKEIADAMRSNRIVMLVYDTSGDDSVNVFVQYCSFCSNEGTYLVAFSTEGTIDYKEYETSTENGYPTVGGDAEPTVPEDPTLQDG